MCVFSYRLVTAKYAMLHNSQFLDVIVSMVTAHGRRVTEFKRNIKMSWYLPIVIW